ncbi:type II secretion system protein [Meiothermus hypogaeus]|uniref:type II secretion system protein n=1 Tax=Meiothermus hypogaeus TaxID=884155 RepID=UPI001FD4F693|nr:prepilin-type N-terminal cleavage/methylation domain-containing protein [Meiothermus hypogaeus]
MRTRGLTILELMVVLAIFPEYWPSPPAFLPASRRTPVLCKSATRCRTGPAWSCRWLARI